jgi:hypothetical protein
VLLVFGAPCQLRLLAGPELRGLRLSRAAAKGVPTDLVAGLSMA